MFARSTIPSQYLSQILRPKPPTALLSASALLGPEVRTISCAKELLPIGKAFSNTIKCPEDGDGATCRLRLITSESTDGEGCDVKGKP